MFEARLQRLDDPAISREIGMLLGNDLGQMRVQFNAKTYVVEPVYRDDGLGLWDFGEEAPSSGETLDLAVDAARVEQRENPDQTSLRPDVHEDDSTVGRARPVAPDQRGIVIAKYPEWDRAHGVERPEWTTCVRLPHGPAIRALWRKRSTRADVLRNRIGRLVRGVRVGRTIRLKRQLDGHDLDLDAVIDAGIALRIARRSPTRASFAPPPPGIAIWRSCCCSTSRNRRAIGSRPAPPSSTSSASRSRFSPKP